MPTDNVKIAGGTLYFGDPETGEILGEINEIKEVKIEPEENSLTTDETIGMFSESHSVSFTCDCEIDRNAALSLVYGRWVTNNWLKMHGGVMKRKRRKH